MVVSKAIRAAQPPSSSLFQEGEKGFFLPMDTRAWFPAPYMCSFLRREGHALMSSLSPPQLPPDWPHVWGWLCLGPLACPVLTGAVLWRGWGTPWTVGGTPVGSGWQKPAAVGPTVALQPGGYHDLPVIYCHNINHTELTWH